MTTIQFDNSLMPFSIELTSEKTASAGEGAAEPTNVAKSTPNNFRNVVFAAIVITGCGCDQSTSPNADAPGAGSLPVNRQVGGSSMPVDVERLTGSSLTYIGGSPSIVWEFTSDSFTLTIEGEPPPNELFEALLGPGRTASRMTGGWHFAPDTKGLMFTQINAGDESGVDEVRLSIEPAGLVRVNLGALQYNILDARQRAQLKNQEKPAE